MAILAIGAAIAGAGTFAAFAIDLAVTAAVSVGTSYAIRAIAGSPEQRQQQQQQYRFSTQGQIQGGGDVPRQFPLGYCSTAGSLVYANQWGESGSTPNAYLTQVIALSDLPGPKLKAVWVSGVRCTYDAAAAVSAPDVSGDLLSEALNAAIAAGLIFNAQAMAAFINDYVNGHGGSTSGVDLSELGIPLTEFRKGGADHVWVKFYDGTQTTADTLLTGKVASTERPYESTRVGTGVAYAICTALVDDTLFTGIPTYKFEMDGIPLYDPSRDDTNGGEGDQRYSDPSTWGGDGDHLPAVQAYNVLRGFRYDGEWFYGLQKTTQANLPAVNWNTQIAKCRAAIGGADGDEPTYRSGGVFAVNTRPADALDALMTACQGKASEVGGFYKVHLGSPDSSVVSITDDDILATEEQTFDPFASLADSANGITGTYPDPEQGWNTSPAPPLYSPDYEAIDGSRRLLADPAFDLVPYAGQVQRLMKSALLAARRERRHSIPLPPPFWFLEPGDGVDWTSARNGYDAKLFAITGVIDRANLDVGLSLQEVDPSDFDYDHDSEYVPPSSGPLTFVRPAAQAIVDWNASASTIYDADGISRRPAILLEWDGSLPGVIGVQYEVRLKSDQSSVARGRTDQLTVGSLLISQSLLPNTQYEVRGQYLPSAPRDMLWSDWITVTTPDVRLSLEDFNDGLRALVRQQIQTAIASVNDAVEHLGATLAAVQANAELDKDQITRNIARSAGQTKASFNETVDVAIGPGSAIAQAITTLAATVDTINASVTTQFVAGVGPDGAIAAYTLKTVAENAEAGLSVVAFDDGVGGQSGQLWIEADKFYVGSPGEADFSPMLIVDTEAGRIYLNGSLIANDTIEAPMIKTGAIEARHLTADAADFLTANIHDLTADNIDSNYAIYNSYNKISSPVQAQSVQISPSGGNSTPTVIQSHTFQSVSGGIWLMGSWVMSGATTIGQGPISPSCSVALVVKDHSGTELVNLQIGSTVTGTSVAGRNGSVNSLINVPAGQQITCQIVATAGQAAVGGISGFVFGVGYTFSQSSLLLLEPRGS